MIRALLSKRYILTTILVLVAMGVMIRLGIWQLDRRQQRLAFNADVAAKMQQAPLSVNDAAVAAEWPLANDRDAVRNIQANARGRFDFDNQLLLLHQNRDNQPGAHLVAPLLLEGSDQAILVDRGWIPVAEAEAGNFSRFDKTQGTVSVAGTLQPSQILFGRAARAAANQETPVAATDKWYRIDVEAIQQQLPYELLPVYLLQAPPPEGNAALPYRSQPEIDLSEGPHMSYALQWFSFALIAGVIYARIVWSREQREGVGRERVAEDGEVVERAAAGGRRQDATYG